MKKILSLGALFLNLSFQSGLYAADLLKIEGQHIIFEESLKVYSDKKIEKLIDLSRKNSEKFNKERDAYFKKKNILNFNQETSKNYERSKDIHYQAFLWSVFKSISQKKNIEIPKPSEIFIQKKILGKNLVKKIHEEDFSSCNFKDLRNFFNSKDILEERKKIKNTEIFHEEISHIHSLFYSLGYIVNNFFKAYQIDNNFLDIALMSFYKILNQYRNNHVNLELLKLNDVFDIMVYVLHKVKQFDVKAKISTKNEKNIKEDFGREFSIYRKQLFEENEDKKDFYQDYIKKIKFVHEKTFRKRSIERVQELSKKNNLFRHIFMNYYKGEDQYEEITTLKLKDLKENLKKDKQFPDIANFSVDSIFYTFYLTMESLLQEDNKIIKPLKDIALNIFFYQCVGKGIDNLSLEEIAHYGKFIQQYAQELSDNYGTAFHESAHAYIAFKHNIKVHFAFCVSHNDALGAIAYTPSESLWSSMSVSVAGILGGFIVSGKICSSGCSSDFREAFKNVKELYELIKSDNNEKLIKEIPGYEQLTPNQKEEELKKFKAKIENYKNNGRSLLKNCKELKNPELEEFFEPSVWKDLENDNDNEALKNIFAGCICETFKTLTERDNNKKTYEILAEKIFDKGILDKPSIEKYVNDVDNDDMMMTYIKSSNFKIGPNENKRKIFIVNDGRSIFPFSKISEKNIEENMDHLKEVARFLKK